MRHVFLQESIKHIHIPAFRRSLDWTIKKKKQKHVASSPLFSLTCFLLSCDVSRLLFITLPSAKWQHKVPSLPTPGSAMPCAALRSEGFLFCLQVVCLLTHSLDSSVFLLRIPPGSHPSQDNADAVFKVTYNTSLQRREQKSSHLRPRDEEENKICHTS